MPRPYFVLTRMVVLAISVSSFLGCGVRLKNDFHSLSSLRVLSLRADTPELGVGETATLTPFVSDVDGSGRELFFEVSACSELKGEQSKRPDCVAASDRVVISSETLITELTAPNYTGQATPVAVSIPTDLLDQYTDVEKLNGVEYRIDYRIYARDQTSVRAVKHLVVSNRSVKNQNPVLSSVESDTGALVTFPAAATTLIAKIDESSGETYQVMVAKQVDRGVELSLVDQVETLDVSWFISDGTLELGKTLSGDNNIWYPPITAPTKHQAILIGVLRDGRGGESLFSTAF